MKSKRGLFIIQFLSLFFWLCLLIPTDSYYSVYLLLGIVASILIYKNYKTPSKTAALDWVFSTIFSIFVSLANYAIYNNTDGAPTALITLLIFITSYPVFLNIIKSFKKFSIKLSKSPIFKNNFKFALICFLIMFIIYLIIFFLCCYPGTLTPDSMSQIEQSLSNNYNNHHPVFATLLIKLFLSIGLAISGDINIGIAFFSVFQILLLSAAITYAIFTLNQFGVSKKIVIPFFILTLIMPYNIMYSFTIWKDVLFGAFFLIFIVSFIRLFKKLDKHITFSIIITIVSGLAVCLFRSNGLIAFAVATILFFIIFKKQYLKIGLMLCGIVAVSFFLKRPLLQILHINQPDTVESLSIPMQQITRTLIENKSSISEDDLNLITNVANPDRLVEEYNPILHDPIKYVVRREGNQNYLKDHKLDFLGLYLRLGFKNPVSYTKAWINQTRGYWNSGYYYWKWADEIFENKLGIEKKVNSVRAHQILHKYLDIFEKFKPLNPFISIGLFAWAAIFLLYKSISDKNKLFIFITLLLILTWSTLLIATPVFAEFRYTYFLFTCVPFVALLSLTNNKSKVKKHEKR